MPTQPNFSTAPLTPEIVQQMMSLHFLHLASQVKLNLDARLNFLPYFGTLIQGRQIT